jgi:hypothetical protein
VTIGVYHVATDSLESEQGYACGRLMIKSARKFMPDVPVVHFTDMDSPVIKGASEVRRKPSEPMALLRMRHHAGVRGDWLFVDTDVIFQHSVRVVLKSAYDIAVTTRNWPHVKDAEGFSSRMPYNMGVVFSRCPHFWAECYSRLRNEGDDVQEWMGDQEVFNDAIASGRYLIKRVSGATYNFPPPIPGDWTSPDKLAKHAHVLHYKGEKRKGLLLDTQESRRCA